MTVPHIVDPAMPLWMDAAALVLALAVLALPLTLARWWIGRRRHRRPTAPCRPSARRHR